MDNNIAEAMMTFVMINDKEVNVPFDTKKLLSTEDWIVVEGQDAEAVIKGYQRKIDQIKNSCLNKVNNEEDESDEGFSTAQISSTWTRALH